MGYTQRRKRYQVEASTPAKRGKVFTDGQAEFSARVRAARPAANAMHVVFGLMNDLRRIRSATKPRPEPSGQTLRIDLNDQDRMSPETIRHILQGAYNGAVRIEWE